MKKSIFLSLSILSCFFYGNAFAESALAVFFRGETQTTNTITVVDGLLKISSADLEGFDKVKIMPEFARAKSGEDGFFILPDGSLGYFKDRKGKYQVKGVHAVMPFWGMKTPRKTFAALTEGMTWDNTIIAESGNGECSVSIEFSMHQKKAEEDIAIRFFDLPASSTYSDMARFYRERQLAAGVCRPISERMKTAPALAYAADAVEVRIRLGWKPAPSPIEHQTLTNEPPMKIAANFATVRRFADACKAEGVKKIQFCLVGWNLRGHDGRYPQIFPVEPQLGGEAELRYTIKYVQSLGYNIVCHNNHSDTYQVSELWDEKDVIQDPKGTLSKNAIWSGGRMYNLCPKIADEKFAPGDLKRIADLGFRGLHYIDVLSIVAPRRCLAPEHPLTRRQSAKHINSLLARAAREMGGIQSEGVYDFCIGNLDYGLYASFSDPFGRPTIIDDRVPFWQLVYHGIAMSNPFTKCVNPTIKSKKIQLKLIEFGGRTSFYAHSNFHSKNAWMGNEDIRIDTPENITTAAKAIKKGYDEYVRRSKLQQMFMNDHCEIKPGVKRISYSNGTKIYVNYNTSPVSAEGIEIPAESSSIIPLAGNL